MSDKYPGGFITANAPAGFSVAFDGTGDYLNWTGSTVGTAAYTFECWFYTGSFAASQTLIGPNSTANNGYGFNVANATTLSIDNYGVSANNFTVPTMSTNTWYHVAVVRNGSGVTTVFLNGLRSSTGTITDTTNYGNVKSIGYTSSAVNRYFSGYISNARYVTAAVYDPTATTITVPTQLFPVTNTSLLTCQSPTIIDNSTNAFTITANGDAKVSNFTPFAAYQGFNPALGAAAGGVWTLDEAAYYQNNRQWPIYDPYFKNTTLMLHGNGTNGAQNNTFLDSSTNNFTITRNGNTTQGSFTPFSQTGWSNYFSGTTDYLQFTSISAYGVGTGNFTLEANTFFNGTSGNQRIFCIGVSGTDGLVLQYTSGTGLLVNIGSTVITYAFTPVVGVWYNFAVVRSGTGAGQTVLYINGVSVATGTSSTSIGQNPAFVGGLSWTSAYTVNGYISNLRYSNVARYTSNFTPSTTPLLADNGTILLTCQSNRFVDNSAINNSIAAVGGSPSVQAFSPFVPAYITPTTYSNWFNGSTGYLSRAFTSTTDGMYPQGTTWTLETWVYMTSTSGDQYIYVCNASNAASFGYIALATSAGVPQIAFRPSTGGTLVQVLGGTVAANTWTHLAASASGGTLRFFVNGVSVGTPATITSSTFTPTGVGIGYFQNGYTAGVTYFTGNISNLRLTQGGALYTANFTPPTAPLTTTVSAGTVSLLTCQSSTFIDNSSNNFTITANGNVQPVTSPTPFPAKVDTTTLNSAYSTSLIGGSGYFDGSGDYLTAPNSTAFDLSTSSHTIECWIYLQATPAVMRIAEYRNGTASNSNYAFALTCESGVFRYTVYSGTTGYAAIGATGTVNQWYHVVCVRNGTTITIYVNGVAGGTTATCPATTNNPAGSVLYVSSDQTSPVTGYMCGFRILKGTALYTSNFAPPLTPPTNISNTSLLLSYTNGAIFDNTAKNVVETVGNAQISTTQSKWGGSSMYFDGTGDWLSIRSSPDLYLSSGPFTIEAWVYPTTNTAGAFVGRRAAAAAQGFFLGYGNVTSQKFSFYAGDSNTGGWEVAITSTNTFAPNTWYFVSVTRDSSNVFTLRVNGSSEGTATNSVVIADDTSPLSVGGFISTSESFNGYLDDVRITKGVARYVTNFTPPTSQLQDQ